MPKTPSILRKSRRPVKKSPDDDDDEHNECCDSTVECKVEAAQEAECSGAAEESTENNSEEMKTSKRGACDKCFYCNDHKDKKKKTDEKESKKRFDCKECKLDGVRRTFSSSEKLEAHINEMHDSSTKLDFLCSECEPPSSYNTKAKYLYHLAAKHPGLVHFVCELCASIFKLKANYKTHMAAHNVRPVKQFSCEVCKGSFVNRAGLNSHLRRFPGPHIQHICTHCGFSFSREKHILNHRCKKLLFEEAAAANRVAEVERLRANEEQSEDSSIFNEVSENTVVIQEVPSVSESEQIIIRDISDQILPGSQVLHFDIGEGIEAGGQQVYHVNIADWNLVAPYVTREYPSSDRTSQ